MDDQATSTAAAQRAAQVGAAGSAKAEPPALSYEQARDELAEVVRSLETGGVTLEESLALWERGEQLAHICERWLEGARARLRAVVDAAPNDD